MKKFNPIKDRIDLTTQLRFPAISPSSMTAFNWTDRHTTKEQAHENWYQSYVLGVRQDPLIEPGQIRAGKIIGERLATDPTYLPEVPRPDIYEYNLTKKWKECLLVGHMDGFTLKKKEILEYKTSQSKTWWNQKSVDENNQVTFYCLLLLECLKINPNDVKIKLIHIPVTMHGDFSVTRNNDPIQIFETKRTLNEVLMFGVKVKKTFSEMLAFVESKKLSPVSLQ